MTWTLVIVQIAFVIVALYAMAFERAISDWKFDRAIKKAQKIREAKNPTNQKPQAPQGSSAHKRT